MRTYVLAGFSMTKGFAWLSCSYSFHHRCLRENNCMGETNRFQPSSSLQIWINKVPSSATDLMDKTSIFNQGFKPHPCPSMTWGFSQDKNCRRAVEYLSKFASICPGLVYYVIPLYVVTSLSMNWPTWDSMTKLFLIFFSFIFTLSLFSTNACKLLVYSSISIILGRSTIGLFFPISALPSFLIFLFLSFPRLDPKEREKDFKGKTWVYSTVQWRYNGSAL